MTNDECVRRVNEDPDGSKNAGLWGGAGIRDNMSLKAETGQSGESGMGW